MQIQTEQSKSTQAEIISTSELLLEFKISTSGREFRTTRARNYRFLATTFMTQYTTMRWQDMLFKLNLIKNPIVYFNQTRV